MYTAPFPSLMPPPLPVVLHSQQLFRDGREILIEHAGETCRLRLTSNNKLILTK